MKVRPYIALRGITYTIAADELITGVSLTPPRLRQGRIALAGRPSFPWPGEPGHPEIPGGTCVQVIPTQNELPHCGGRWPDEATGGGGTEGGGSHLPTIAAVELTTRVSLTPPRLRQGRIALAGRPSARLCIR